MGLLKNIILSPAAMNVIVGIGLITGAYLFEILGGFEPCPLCILQRWAFGLIALVGLFLIIPNLPSLIAKFLMFLASLCAAAGAVIAGRQIYLQHLPSDQIPTCAPPMDFLLDTLPFLEVIQTILKGDGNCAEIQWKFIFNFAEWALIFFVGLFLYNFYFFLKGLRK